MVGAHNHDVLNNTSCLLLLYNHVVMVNAVVWVFAIIIIGISTTALEFTIAVIVNSNNDYSKYLHYDIYQYSQRKIPV